MKIEVNVTQGAGKDDTYVELLCLRTHRCKKLAKHSQGIQRTESKDTPAHQIASVDKLLYFASASA